MRVPILSATIVYLLACLPTLARPSISRKAFPERALEILPVEERYNYHKAIKKGLIHQPGQNFGASPTESELAITPKADTLKKHDRVSKQWRPLLSAVRHAKFENNIPAASHGPMKFRHLPMFLPLRWSPLSKWACVPF